MNYNEKSVGKAKHGMSAEKGTVRERDGSRHRDLTNIPKGQKIHTVYGKPTYKYPQHTVEHHDFGDPHYCEIYSKKPENSRNKL
jgi:hypothetical protein